MAASRRQPGLWFSALTVKVEAVRPAHKLRCAGCNEAPVTRRLFVKRGAGRRQVCQVFCIACGKQLAVQFTQESHNLQLHLDNGTTPVRLPAPEDRGTPLVNYQ